ncbi:MAG: hypothetical protein AB8B89_03985 [Gammaproteobacteria bacterium]
MKNQSLLLNPIFWLLASLTLGLAPFSPEPHVWEKLKWVFSGAQGMKLIDWFDLVMHGTPWAMLLISLANKFKKQTG